VAREEKADSSGRRRDAGTRNDSLKRARCGRSRSQARDQCEERERARRKKQERNPHQCGKRKDAVPGPVCRSRSQAREDEEGRGEGGIGGGECECRRWKLRHPKGRPAAAQRQRLLRRNERAAIRPFQQSVDPKPESSRYVSFLWSLWVVDVHF
jgi:hypothetical protein